jgi:GxxExxY protein
MMRENEITGLVVDLCYNIHRKYGPGLFESVYESIFVHEWTKTNIPFMRQKGIRVVHDGADMGIAFVPDLILESKVIIELKSVESINDIHYKQLLTYLRLTNLKVGLLINFNVPLIKNGIKRIANNI